MIGINNDIYKSLSALKNEILSVADFYDLQKLLKVEGRTLEELINRPSYNTFEIPKKKGGHRKIQAPSADLLAVQKRLNRYFQAIYLLVKPNEVHGFINKPEGFEYCHSIVSNAKPHVNKKHVLNIDLKDFFPSISAKRVRQILVNQIGINGSQIADVLALLCTYQKSLPIGAPTSPVMSNFACLEMDKELVAYCLLKGIDYTRYADDLTFSSNEYLTETIIQVMRTIINKHDFTINEKKFRLLSSKSKQTVTGIIVNKKVNVDRTYIRNIRATLHHIKTEGIEEAAKKHYKVVIADQFLQQKLLFKVKGQIDFVGQVRGREDGIYLKMILMMNTQKQEE
jgi:RNA-directed DNA polymerase